MVGVTNKLMRKLLNSGEVQNWIGSMQNTHAVNPHQMLQMSALWAYVSSLQETRQQDSEDLQRKKKVLFTRIVARLVKPLHSLRVLGSV